MKHQHSPSSSYQSTVTSAPTVKYLLEAQHVTVTGHAGQTILDKADIQVLPGEMVALLGANGAGKSTFTAVIAGENLALPIPSGKVQLNELNVRQTPPKILAQHRAVLTQNTQLDFNLAVLDIVEMGAYPFSNISNLDEVVQQALTWANIKHLTHRPYQQLSGGEKQRVQFARVLVQLLLQHDIHQPRYCLLDEPTSSLDPKHQQSLLKTLKQLAKELHIGVFLVLHDVNLAAFYCDRLVLLSQGKTITQGPPKEVLNADNLEATYGLRGHPFPHPLSPDKVFIVWEEVE
ncbi:heme ABC transporter ATP-binding protein [Pelistega europaea]|uniref:Heme ABC transporter ATP-binding protein n=1 Tax=Pelistega europaea TaxID=106147 RepID=A0A7Y4L8Z9_9BURK|nr:heme ABC transporter ATP-binding protein [Pelistega europaea]NOL49165.1 heme ABC transporter ATP-binding protein [Pelistega europaea]